MNSRKVRKILLKDGWYYVRSKGDDDFYKHKSKKGLVKLQHGAEFIPKGTLNNIWKQAGLK